jgi:hypothetical protein
MSNIKFYRNWHKYCSPIWVKIDENIKTSQMHVHLLFGLSQPYMMENVPVGITAFREVLIFEANLICALPIPGGRQ